MSSTEVVQVVQSTSRQADEFVTGRFQEAQSYAANAWEEAQNYLAEMSSKVSSPGIDTDVSIAFDYTGEEITENSHGDKPVKPDINTDKEFDEPSCGALKELPAFSYLTGEIDTLREDLLAKVETMLTYGATGLDPEVEQAIWDRAIGRKDLENLRMYTEAEQYYSARGFDLPTGALVGKLQEINLEIVRNNNNLNNDIMVEQAKLEQSNQQYVITEGIKATVSMMEASMNSVLNYNKGVIEKFMADVEEYKQEVAGWMAGIEAKTKVYVTETEGYKAMASVDVADVTAQVEIAKISMTEAQLKSDLKLKEAQLELDSALKLFQLQVEAIRAGSQVTAQIVASALSAVNASANYGFSGSASLGSSDGYSTTYDATKGVETHQYIDQRSTSVSSSS